MAEVSSSFVKNLSFKHTGKPSCYDDIKLIYDELNHKVLRKVFHETTSENEVNRKMEEIKILMASLTDPCQIDDYQERKLLKRHEDLKTNFNKVKEKITDDQRKKIVSYYERLRDVWYQNPLLTDVKQLLSEEPPRDHTLQPRKSITAVKPESCCDQLMLIYKQIDEILKLISSEIESGKFSGDTISKMKGQFFNIDIKNLYL